MCCLLVDGLLLELLDAGRDTADEVSWRIAPHGFRSSETGHAVRGQRSVRPRWAACALFGGTGNGSEVRVCARRRSQVFFEGRSSAKGAEGDVRRVDRERPTIRILETSLLPPD
jgi:hypothetical protein